MRSVSMGGEKELISFGLGSEERFFLLSLLRSSAMMSRQMSTHSSQM